MRRYAIADMHGRFDLCHEAFLTIIDHAKTEPYEIVVMGDFVDRGPESAKLIRFLQKWQNRGAVVLQGNHEDMMIACCTGQAKLGWWIGNGGDQTLMSYGYQNGDLLEPFKGSLKEDLLWLASLPKYYETEKQVFVHAGVAEGVPLEQQTKDWLQWHCFDAEWRGDWDGVHNDVCFDKHVVHGHEQWANGPIQLEGRTDLDTFAWYTGRLAIGVFDDTQGKPIDILWAVGEPHGGS